MTLENLYFPFLLGEHNVLGTTRNLKLQHHHMTMSDALENSDLKQYNSWISNLSFMPL